MGPIVITGAGIVSAIGVGKSETLASLIAGKSGIGGLKYLNTTHHEFPVGEVPLSNTDMRRMLGTDDNPLITRTALMGRLALREALNEAGLDASLINESAFISGTTVGGMDLREANYAHEQDCDFLHAQIASHSCGSSTEMIAEPFGHFAMTSTVSTACSSAANAIITGANLIKCGEANIVVAGGAECLTKFHLNGFNTLMILDHEPCRPFDKDRAGLNLGEGAAYLVLESLDHAIGRGAQPLCYLAGYGNACDAFHQTASSPDGDGSLMAMKEAQEMAGLRPSDINYINAHGTGTPNNDESESRALKRLFGNDLPPVSSTKSFTGHTTSASGSIEGVICLLALQHQFVPVNLNWKTAMDDGIIPATDSHPQHEIRNIQSNAFGFGGNDSSLIFSKYEDYSQSNYSIVNPPIFIQAAEQVSIQQPLSEEWMTTPEMHTEPLVHAVNPQYRDFMSPLEARRMAHVTKRALATSLKVIESTGIKHPDAIITGTSIGSLDYTEKFLNDLTTNGEELLKPTLFMQSTHNTVGSTLGIYTKNHGYNTTYSHDRLTFEQTLHDACLQMRLGMIKTALVGGHDEMVDHYFEILKKAKYVGLPGMVPCGEVAVSMMLTTNAEANCLCEVCGITFGGKDRRQYDALKQLCEKVGIPVSGLSGVMTGINGNPSNDACYTDLETSLQNEVPLLKYKHVFGENHTVSALGVYAAAHILKEGVIPSFMHYGGKSLSSEEPHYLAVVNHSEDQGFAITLLKKI